MMYGPFAPECDTRWGAIRRAVIAHYRARGVTSERKLSELAHRWRLQKGMRAPTGPSTP